MKFAAGLLALGSFHMAAAQLPVDMPFPALGADEDPAKNTGEENREKTAQTPVGDWMGIPDIPDSVKGSEVDKGLESILPGAHFGCGAFTVFMNEHPECLDSAMKLMKLGDIDGTDALDDAMNDCRGQADPMDCIVDKIENSDLIDRMDKALDPFNADFVKMCENNGRCLINFIDVVVGCAFDIEDLVGRKKDNGISAAKFRVMMSDLTDLLCARESFDTTHPDDGTRLCVEVVATDFLTNLAVQNLIEDQGDEKEDMEYINPCSKASTRDGICSDECREELVHSLNDYGCCAHEIDLFDEKWHEFIWELPDNEIREFFQQSIFVDRIYDECDLTPPQKCEHDSFEEGQNKKDEPDFDWDMSDHRRHAGSGFAWGIFLLIVSITLVSVHVYYRHQVMGIRGKEVFMPPNREQLSGMWADMCTKANNLRRKGVSFSDHFSAINGGPTYQRGSAAGGSFGDYETDDILLEDGDGRTFSIED
eukprot:Clim_evm9s205 gene=Clim_evmTU9s205